MRSFSAYLLTISLLLVLEPSRSRAVERDVLQPGLRRPIALQLAASEEWLYAANQRSGSISVIGLDEPSVVQEFSIGEQLSALERFGPERLLAADPTRHELMVLQADGKTIRVQQRLAVSPYPVSIAVAPDTKRCSVASLWSRRLTFVALPSTESAQARVESVVDLPFAPRCQLFVREGEYLIAADSFGGRLAVVDMSTRELLHVREFPAHNIRGLRLSADGQMLLIAHQMLNELAHTVRNDVHWGLLMSNDLRWLRLDAVLSKDADLYDQAHMHPLGHAGSATADPSGLAVTSQGTVIVSLGGVGEIAIGKEDDFGLRRVAVGRRPTSLAASMDGQYVYVANTFGETISIVDIADRSKVKDIALGPAAEPQLSLVDRGEQLFYDGSLSHDGWMSCHSCHTDGHTNGLLNDNFSDASFGAPKRVLSLLGRADTSPFAWNGDAKSLDAQIRKSIRNTMQGYGEVKDEQVSALVAYLRTLPPPPSIDEVRGKLDRAAVERGRKVFAAQQCGDCHAPPSYTSAATYDVGLADQLGNQQYNPPPLRGVGQRGPFFHDGRAKQLVDVFRQFKHQLHGELNNSELDDLQSFLRSL